MVDSLLMNFSFSNELWFASSITKTLLNYYKSKTDEVISVSFSRTISLLNVTLESVHHSGRKRKVQQFTKNFKCSGLGICISVLMFIDEFDHAKWNNLLCFTGNVNPWCSLRINSCIFITRLIKVQVNLLPSKGKPSPRYSTVHKVFIF